MTQAAPASRAGRSVAKNGADHLPLFVQEICPSAPIDIAASDIEQIARVGRVAGEDDAVALDRFNAVTADRGGAVAAADNANKPAIVVIDRRDFFRDCFVRCLKVVYSDRRIDSFASIADWCGSAEIGAASVAVVIVVVETGDGGLADRGFIERTEGKIPVVIVSDIDDLDHIVGALKRGARGYIPSSLPFNVAVEAVRLVEAGGVFGPATSLSERAKPVPEAKGHVALTERQMKVLEEIRHGKANKQIAYALQMSEHTVKLHLRHIMRKLNVRNRTEVAVFSETLLASQKDL